MLAKVPGKDRPPRDQRELMRSLDEREAAAHEIETALEPALDRRSRNCLLIIEAKFPSELLRHAKQLPPPERRQQIGRVACLFWSFLRKPLLDQPPPSCR